MKRIKFEVLKPYLNNNEIMELTRRHAFSEAYPNWDIRHWVDLDDRSFDHVIYEKITKYLLDNKIKGFRGSDFKKRHGGIY